LLWVAPTVAWAAVASGVAREFCEVEEYRQRLEARLGRARGLMRGVINRASRNPKRIVFPEGEELKVIRAARILIDDNIADPILLGSRERIAEICRDANIDAGDIDIEDAATSTKREAY